MKLDRSFYARKTTEVARDLLGKYLVHRIVVLDGPTYSIEGMIVETEAYDGVEDRAAHASHGITPRSKPLFGEVGHAYVYLIYGTNFCFNAVAHPPGEVGAVLFRAAELSGDRKDKYKAASGCGRLCKAFQISKLDNTEDLTGNSLWLEDRGLVVKDKDVAITPRVNVDYAGEWAKKKWRYYIKGNKAVSRP